ncbi:hypothetical protein LTR36_002452 [Oleoguttula mirabilis]|uniref:Arabinogalactan endo-beta-1,4-galactanase n=1 Tax=Oleoguttula mirabilis TaxID=1507867 RepID=A0AAV9JLU9_9PEZI|nr:hypothetical protein LTR36_002452 [Oleoguttula mirabilis]
MFFQSIIPFFLPVAHAALAYKGVDWSSLLVEEASGKSYIGIDGNTKSLELILKNNGVTTVRQRIWNNPSNGDYDLDYNLKLAKRAHAQGLGIYLDFHFSDTWADPGDQTTPTAWQGYGVDDLADEVKNYTMSTMNSFQSAGIPLSLVSIGNEITAGMLWPTGEMSESSGPANLATLLHAASAGIKASTLTTQPKILIHLDNGWDWETQEWWYDTVLGEGPLTADDYDVQGVSYYPFYNADATLASLKSSLTSMVSKYGKAVMVVETNWPASCPDPSYTFPSDAKSIPYSTAGQTTWMKDVASAVEAAGGSGVFYWEPAWLDNAALGSSCANNLMFGSNGHALDSVEVFRSI